MHARACPDSDVPPLENGDCLDREEFRRRYQASPHIKEAELVDGVVYVASPVKKQHGRPHSHVVSWVTTYEAFTPGAEAFDNTTLILDGENEHQPDALLRWTDGPCRDTPDDYLKGPPELIAEVANSSSAYDLNQKREVYRRAGVREYVVLVVRERRVRWFDLVDELYIERDVPEDGVYRSATFPGLWLNADALLVGDARRLLETARAGIDSPAHAEILELRAR